MLRRLIITVGPRQGLRQKNTSTGLLDGLVFRERIQVTQLYERQRKINEI